MKKIIGGKKYDTDTAVELGRGSNSGGWGDFGHYEETLFRKKTGEYFLRGVGGPATKYAVSEGQNSWSGGSQIIPLSVDSAREWAEQNLDADDYESIFGEAAEGDGKTIISASVMQSVVDAAQDRAKDQGLSFSAYIESALKEANKS